MPGRFKKKTQQTEVEECKEYKKEHSADQSQGQFKRKSNKVQCRAHTLTVLVDNRKLFD